MAAQDKTGSTNRILMTLLNGRTLIVLAILVVFFSVTAPNFFTVNSLLSVAKHVALYGILAIGMTYVIITGGIDLSVGSVAGIAGMISTGFIQEGLTLEMFSVTVYLSVPVLVIVTLILGALMGMLNGLVITKLKVAPFIATLGTMYVWRGFANIRSNGATFSSVYGSEGLGNTGFDFFGTNLPGTPIPCGVLILAIFAIVAAIVLRRTPFGWHILAIGGNENAAKLSGIKVDKDKVVVYAISGFCAAMVGIIAASQLMSGSPKTGEAWEMNAIAATVLGGTSMAGGIGNIGGTIVGAFVIGVINDGMTMCGVTEFWQQIIRGIVIIVAVVIDMVQRDLQAKMALQARGEDRGDSDGSSNRTPAHAKES